MNDERIWRVGTHYGIHIYAEESGVAQDEPIGTTHRRAHAEQIVRDHNTLYGRSASWVDPRGELTKLVKIATEERDAARKEIARLSRLLTGSCGELDRIRTTLSVARVDVGRVCAALMDLPNSSAATGSAPEAFTPDFESRCE